MTQLVQTKHKLFFGEFDMTGDMSSLAMEYGAEQVGNTVYGLNTRRFLGGLKSVAIAHEGFVNQDNADPVLFDAVGVAGRPMTLAAQPAAEGDVAYAFQPTMGGYSPGGTVGEMFAFSVAGAARSDLIRGALMVDRVATATVDGPGVELGAVAAGQRMFAALHVIAASVADTLDVIIESDSDNLFNTPTTRLTFTQQAAVASEWLVPVAGPVTDTWWRAAITIAGTAPSFTLAAFFGIN